MPILIQGLSPHLSAVHRDSEVLYDSTRMSFVRYILGLVLCIGLGFIIFGRDILYYLYGSDFMPAIIIIPFSAVTLFFNYLNAILAIFMNIAGKGKVVAYTTFISLLINGMLNFMFIPYFFNLYGKGGSGVGASLTTNISELSVFIGFIFVMGIKKSNKIIIICI